MFTFRNLVEKGEWPKCKPADEPIFIGSGVQPKEQFYGVISVVLGRAAV